MHRRSLLASSKERKTSEERPRKRPQTTKSGAFITKSNNPHSQKNTDKSLKEKPKKSEENTENKPLPKYLTFLFNVFSYPIAFISWCYSWVIFVADLPRKTRNFLNYLAGLPLIWILWLKDLPAKFLIWCSNNLEGLLCFCAEYHLGGLLILGVAFWICPLPNMTYPLFALLRLVLGTLYPAYASYKAVRTKNVKEYVKWMMYWIVFAIFASLESFADIFVAFWFPFYYEVKILLLIWLISPVSRGSLGSSILYRRFVHPSLVAREEEIDRWILKLQEQGYNTVTKLAVKAFNYASNMIMQTAIRAPELMNELIEAQRLEQNQDSTDSRFVEVMDTIDTDLNQENLDNSTEEELKEPKKNYAEMSSEGSETDNDPDFVAPKPVKKRATRQSKRTRSKSNSAKK